VRGDDRLPTMRVLVTGADGFVGRHLVPRLVQQGHQVIAGCRPTQHLDDTLLKDWGEAVRVVPLELADSEGIRAAFQSLPEAVIHLAAIASVREARQDPAQAWLVNAVGTARLLDAMIAGRPTGADPVVLVVSTAEVYGAGPTRARLEADVPAPQSPYAASKLAGEIAALEAWRRSGLRVLVARPFIHTGPGQHPPYVIPSFIQRLLAVRAGTTSKQVPTGNMEIVRDLLDVRDVVEAYILLLLRGRPGETYNVARGQGLTLRDIFRKIAEEIGVSAEPVPDSTLIRPGDITHLVGDSAKLRGDTGWSPVISLEQTLRDMVHAQAH
jgi:GDP-4-dehydro-6-deoxy-D-mannose reductase